MFLEELKRRWWEASLLIIAVLAITAFHYGTHSFHHLQHDVYRRLYYLPIIIAGFRFGFWGAVSTSLLATVLYIPHAFFYSPNIDPADTLDKLMEIMLYNIIALVTGGLVLLLRSEGRKHEKTAERLQTTLDHVERIQFQLRIAERLAAIGQLTAGLAHELRNPLSSIRGTAEILADDYSPDHPKYEMAGVLLKESARLNEILDSFLDFARPRPLQIQEKDLRSELSNVVETLNQHSAKGEHDIVLDVKGDVPRVQVDPDRLMQVFLNLGINALEAMEKKGTLTIRLSTKTRDDRRCVSIIFQDEGPGIDQKTVEKIFNPFFTTKQSGTGLGLPISHRIVEDHGGRIEVTSTPGEGSTFEILLPVEGGVSTSDESCK